MVDTKITSKIKLGFYLWALFMLCGVLFFACLILAFMRRYVENGALATIGWFALFSLMLSSVLIVLRDFKYIILNGQQMTVFSIYNLFGKRYDLQQYVGIIVSKEYGSLGAYKTVYLVDKAMYTKVKINGIFYRNYVKIIDHIDLPEIKDYDFGVLKYLQLIFTGRIKIDVKEKKKK